MVTVLVGGVVHPVRLAVRTDERVRALHEQRLHVLALGVLHIPVGADFRSDLPIAKLVAAERCGNGKSRNEGVNYHQSPLPINHTGQTLVGTHAQLHPALT